MSSVFTHTGEAAAPGGVTHRSAKRLLLAAVGAPVATGLGVAGSLRRTPGLVDAVGLITAARVHARS